MEQAWFSRLAGMSSNPSFLLKTTLRAAGLGLVDAVSVGLWHPRLAAWRAVESLRRGVAPAGGARRFDAHLAARRTGQPQLAFVQGATPWYALRRVARVLGLRPGTRFVDVGAADGMAAAVLAVLSGASGYAVEPQDALRLRAEQMYRALGVPLGCAATLRAVPLSSCHAAFGGWTCLDPSTRQHLLDDLTALPTGSRLVTVTHAPQHPAFRVVTSWRATMPWGRDELFAAERT
ncbi:MAG: hypothetical protein AB2A00_32655 [Myxococcota bacterium]